MSDAQDPRHSKQLYRSHHTEPLPQCDKLAEKVRRAKVGDLSDDDVESLARMVSNTHFRNEVLSCWNLYDKKGKDYTRGKGDEDRLDNFKQAAEENNTTPRQAWGILYYKHHSALRRFIREGFVESEGIESRIHDMINYLILLSMMIKEDVK